MDNPHGFEFPIQLKRSPEAAAECHPALAYLDIIRQIRTQTHLPIAAYKVSEEYAKSSSSTELD